MTGGRRRRGDRFGEEDVNPMSFLSNLSDVMLIFAVGVILALAAYWQLDISPASAREEADTPLSDARTFTSEEREQMRSDATEGTSSEGMRKTGEVYYDPDTETYYIVELGGG